MRYYAKFNDGTQTKNKAQKSAYGLMNKYGSVLLNSDAALQKMVDNMKIEISLINSVNPRCSDIDFRSYLHDDYRGKSAHIGDICSFSFYPVLSEFNVLEIEQEQEQPANSTVFNF